MTHTPDPQRWRLELAERIAAAYARNPNTAAIMIAGSVGRGRADRWSDIEIDVYYHRPPTITERRAAVEHAGGTLLALDEDDDEWEERMRFGAFEAATSTFLTSTMERYLNVVVDRADVAPLAQTRLSALLHALPVMGHTLIERWRARAAAYPDALIDAMLREHLRFDSFWRNARMLAERDDRLLLVNQLLRTAERLMRALCGLNRRYLPTPDGLKWMDESIAALPIAPSDLARRLRRVFESSPEDAVRELESLIDETLILVATHRPHFDLAPYRRKELSARGPWNAPPG
jgi:predicted nucleotidyltransferase